MVEGSIRQICVDWWATQRIGRIEWREESGCGGGKGDASFLEGTADMFQKRVLNIFFFF